MRNRVAEIDWRTYLDASLFPLKIYTALAVIWMVIWYACLPTYVPHSLNFNVVPYLPDPVSMAMDDFYTFASFVAAGYILSGLVMLVGGIIQMGVSSRRSWIWSLSFSGAALAIGIGMACFAGGMAQFAPGVFMNVCA